MSGATLNLADLLEIASDTVGDEREAVVCGERRHSVLRHVDCQLGAPVMLARRTRRWRRHVAGGAAR